MDFKAISDFLTALSPVETQGLALVSTLGAAFIAYRSAVANARKNLFVTTITGERAKWRQDLRTEMSELAKAVELALGEPEWAFATPASEHVGAFHAHRVAILLRLNPHPSEIDEKTIPASLKALTDAVRRRHRDDAHTYFAKLEASIQKLLKLEWDKSKKEAETGKLQPETGLFYRAWHFIMG